MTRVSIVTPAYNEADNLEAFYARLMQVTPALGCDWEWIVIDDHSRDATFACVERLARRDPRVRAIRLSRNSGSHVAITCGLHHARGDAAVVLAADLQDPPELLEPLLERWRGGAQIVWGARRTAPSGFSSLYYWMMRRVVGMTEMPANGADVFLMDRAALDAFRSWSERNASVLGLVTWLGYRQETIEYDKQPRAAGRSGWTLSRKLRLIADSLTAFSDAPIRWCAYAGVLLGLGAVGVGAVGFIRFEGLARGLAGVVAAVMALSALNLVALSAVGAYVWRTLDQARGRPLYLVERAVGGAPSPSAEVS